MKFKISKKKRHNKSGVYPVKNFKRPSSDGKPETKSEKPKKQRKKLKISPAALKKAGFGAGIITFLLILAFGFYQGYKYIYTSPKFYVSKLTVTPLIHVDKEELLRIADIKPHTNIFRLDLKKLSKKLVAHPWIKQAYVWRELPDILHMELVEQKAVAAVKFEAGCSDNNCDNYSTFYLINEEGAIFKRAEIPDLKGLPVFSGFAKSGFRENPERFRFLVKRNLKIIKKYKTYSSLPEISEVFTKGDSIVLILSNTSVSVYINPSDFSRGIENFASFLSGFDMNLKDVAEIYLDNRENPSRIIVIPALKIDKSDKKNKKNIKS